MLKFTLLSRILILSPLFTLVAAAGQAPESRWDNVRMLASGSPVRVGAGNSRTVDGKLDGVTDSSLVVTAANGPQTFDRAQIVSVSLKKDGHRVRNTFIGLGAGLVGGFAVGAIVGHGCTGFLCGPASVIGGTAVGLVGGTVGGLACPTGGWRKVYQK